MLKETVSLIFSNYDHLCGTNTEVMVYHTFIYATPSLMSKLELK